MVLLYLQIIINILFKVVRTRMAIARTGVYNNIFDCFMKLSRELGMRSLYKGILPSLIGIVPNAGIDLCIYEVR